LKKIIQTDIKEISELKKINLSSEKQGHKLINNLKLNFKTSLDDIEEKSI
jgi:hypothetical protein